MEPESGRVTDAVLGDGGTVALVAVAALMIGLALFSMAQVARKRRGWPVALVWVVAVVLVTLCLGVIMGVTERFLWVPEFLPSSDPQAGMGQGLYTLGLNAVLALALAVVLASLAGVTGRRRGAAGS